MIGFLLAVLSFSQTAASIGIVIESFRPLGGGFFSWRSGQNNLALRLYQGQKKVPPTTLIDVGRTGLGLAPLSARSLWMVGKGLEADGQQARARQVMSRAEQVTRRDVAVQLWLADDKLRREQIAPALHHYDLIVRIQPAAGEEVIPRLALLMTRRLGRDYLQPYIRPDNGWLPALLGTAAGKLPKAEPVARLLIERKAKAPKVPELEPIYSQLVYRLIAEGSNDVALAVYPLLPKSDPAALADVRATVDGKSVEGYPPFTWFFADGATQGATLIDLGGGNSGIEFSGSSGTAGVAATKLVAPRSGAQLQWAVRERSTNLQSSATWVATCLAGSSKGESRKSVDLLSETTPLNKPLAMPLPTGCELVRLDMRIAGGIGRNAASLIVGGLRLAGVAPRD